MSFGKRTYISPSQLKMLLDCPTRWWFAYVNRPPVTKSAWLPFGGAYHKALEYFFTAKMQGDDPAVLEVESAFTHAFTNSLKREEYAFAGTPGRTEFARRGPNLVTSYLNLHGGVLEPKAVEQRFNIGIKDAGFSLKGVIDLVTERRDSGATVIDHKTSDKGWLGEKQPSEGWAGRGGKVALHLAKPGGRADCEIQSYAYPWAHWRLTGELPDRFEFHVVSPQGLEIHRIRRTEKELEWFERLATAYFKMTQGDAFPPRDNWWGCNPRWCDYWEHCKGKYQKIRTDF